MSNNDIKPPNAERADVLVIGGGVSGITAALELSRLGLKTTIAEKQADIGGVAATFCCKASEVCNKCFACVADKIVGEATGNAGISILRETEVVELRKDAGVYRAAMIRGGERLEKVFSAVLLATGISPYDAALKGEYGYGVIKNVITARDLEDMLRRNGMPARPSDGAVPRKIAFIQCVGSRDRSAGRAYCSQVCCAYALRLIRAIRHKFADVNFAFFYMDIQPAGAHFSDFLRLCRQDEKIRFIRSLPSRIYQTHKNDGLLIKMADTAAGEIREEDFDLVVLSVGMEVDRGVLPLAESMGLARDADGFFQPRQGDGFFVTGACTGPKDIDRSITQSKAAAFQIYGHLKAGTK